MRYFLKRSTQIVLALLLFSVGILHSSQLHAQDKQLVFKGRFAASLQAKKLMLTIWSDPVLNPSTDAKEAKVHYADIVDDKFSIAIPLDSTISYMRLDWSTPIAESHNYDNYYPFLVEAGDSISMVVEPYWGIIHSSVMFHGVGSEKFECIQYLFQSAFQNEPLWTKANAENYQANTIGLYTDRNIHQILLQREILKIYQHDLSREIYGMLNAAVSTSGLNNPANYFTRMHPDQIASAEERIKITDVLAMIQRELDTLENAYGSYVVHKGWNYHALRRNMAIAEAFVNRRSVVDVMLEKQKERGFEQMLTSFLLSSINSSKIPAADRDRLNDAAVEMVHHPLYSRSIRQIKEAKNVGAPMYNFELPNTKGKLVKLSDFEGKVVFIDYWFTGCGFCSEYYEEVVRPVKDHFAKDKEVMFMSVSTDREKEMWVKSVKSGKFTSKKAINLICPEGPKDPVIQHYGINAYPHPQLVDKQGRLFSDSDLELRQNGVEGLIEMIEKAKEAI